ncbi:MAG: tRNA epoxyqueuosine(34) reductase QueG [Candidatus Latescibacterota bacterium]
MSLADAIRARALELGFDRVGFTSAEPLAGRVFLASWLDLGYAGGMEYLKRHLDRRGDPALQVPGARTVICLAAGYTPALPSSGDPGRGRISAYALGPDYHLWLVERLRLLWGFIAAEAGRSVHGRWYVDTGPVLERELAVRAGLGWRGKNTCLIDQRQGSYAFLGEILTDLELPGDAPGIDRCGTCTRCLEACPTQALVAPYLLDARRCIAYLTVELKGAVPRELREGMGAWIFGCDLCQEVCPWNRRSASRETGSTEERAAAQPSLVELLELDRKAFKARFGHTPVERTRRRGLLRSVAVALGNAGDRRAVPALVQALLDEEPLVRGHAAWALGRLGGDQARQALAQALDHESDPAVAEELGLALADASRD